MHGDPHLHRQLTFWKDIAAPVPSVRTLGTHGMEFTQLCEKTSAGYDALLRLHPLSVKTRLEYGKFLLEVGTPSVSILFRLRRASGTHAGTGRGRPNRRGESILKLLVLTTRNYMIAAGVELSVESAFNSARRNKSSGSQRCTYGEDFAWSGIVWRGTESVRATVAVSSC